MFPFPLTPKFKKVLKLASEPSKTITKWLFEKKKITTPDPLKPSKKKEMKEKTIHVQNLQKLLIQITSKLNELVDNLNGIPELEKMIIAEIKERIKQKGEDLKMLEGQDRLIYLIDIAKDVKTLPSEVKIEENRIRGCASNLWLIGGCNEDNTMIYKIDAEAFITKGTAKLVTDLVQGCPREEVASLTIDDFLPLGIRELLTMQRQNGLGSLIERIVAIANTK